MARSRLYQSQCLYHFAAFLEIYKILCTFAPLHPENFITLHFFRDFLDFKKKILNSLQKLSIFAAIFA